MNKYSTDNEIIENPKIDENKRYISRFNLVIQNLLEKINNIKNLNLFSF